MPRVLRANLQLPSLPPFESGNAPGVTPASKNLKRRRWNMGSLGASPTRMREMRLSVKRAGWES